MGDFSGYLAYFNLEKREADKAAQKAALERAQKQVERSVRGRS